MSIELNRVGEFFISDDFLHESLDAVQKIMGEVVVVSCVHNYGYGRFEYIAFSRHFRPVPLGEVAPLYDCIVNYTAKTFISFEEKDR